MIMMTAKEIVKHDLRQMVYYLTRMWGEMWFPKLLVGLGTALVLYIFPGENTARMGVAAFAMIMIDMFAGIVAAWAVGEKIQSLKLRRTAIKIFGYFCTLAVVAICTTEIKSFQPAATFSANAVLTVVILSEAWSFLENAKKMGLSLPKGIEDALRERLGRGWLKPDAEHGLKRRAEDRDGN